MTDNCKQIYGGVSIINFDVPDKLFILPAEIKLVGRFIFIGLKQCLYIVYIGFSSILAISDPSVGIIILADEKVLYD